MLFNMLLLSCYIDTNMMLSGRCLLRLTLVVIFCVMNIDKLIHLLMDHTSCKVNSVSYFSMLVSPVLVYWLLIVD